MATTVTGVVIDIKIRKKHIIFDVLYDFQTFYAKVTAAELELPVDLMKMTKELKATAPQRGEDVEIVFPPDNIDRPSGISEEELKKWQARLAQNRR